MLPLPCNRHRPRAISLGRLLFILFVLICGTNVAAFADHYLPHHRVLLLNSYHAGYPWSDGITAAINTELTRAEHAIDFSVEYLDAIRFEPSQGFHELETFLLTKYRQRRPDMVIVADDPALHFLLPRRDKLFPGIPVVFCGINNLPDGLLTGEPNITGVVENIDMAGTIDLILRLHPRAGQIAFVTGSSVTSQSLLQVFRQAGTSFRHRIAFIELSDLTLAELATALRRLPADAVILHTPILFDRDGVPLSPEGSLALLTEYSDLPFYSLWEHSIGDVGVGGIITSAVAQGENAAAIALRILHGEAPEQIAIVRHVPNQPIFNYPVLRRYQLDEAALPEGSILRHRPTTFYEDHPEIVWLGGISFALLGLLTIALLVNVLKKRQALTLLKSRKNQLQQIIESLPVGIFLADRSGRLLMSNRAGREIWGGERKVGIEEYDVYKGWWADSGRPITALEWGMARAIRGGETSLDELIDIETFDSQRKTINHSAIPLRDLDGTIIGGLVVVQDVTEQLRAERTLLALANEWQSTFDALGEAIVLLDKDFHIMHCNRAFLQLTGKEPQAITGRHCWELMHHSDEPLHSCPFARMLQSGRSETDEFHHDDRWWETRVDPIFDDDGKLYGAIHIISDITTRKRAELDRQTLISQLEERNAELERFTYSVSHDLKTPLVTINGFVGQLRQDLAKDDRECIAIDLDFIESSAMQMAALLDNLLHLARSGRVVGDPRPVDLPRIAREAMELARGILDKSTIQLDFIDDLPAVPGDGERLREVFQNLIENAAKFCRNRPNPQIEIGGKVDGAEVRCWVRDNGIGISPQYLERIFGLFERLNSSTPGTGIGLSLARRIIEKHGGRIWAESAGEGAGSTFYFTLPL